MQLEAKCLTQAMTWRWVPPHERGAHLAEQVAVLAVGLLGPTPRRMAQQVDAHPGEQVGAVRAGLDPDGVADRLLELGVERRAPRHRHRERGAARHDDAAGAVGETRCPRCCGPAVLRRRSAPGCTLSHLQGPRRTTGPSPESESRSSPSLEGVDELDGSSEALNTSATLRSMRSFRPKMQGAWQTGPMERLTAADASFLYMENPVVHMHVTGVMVLDPTTMPGGYSFDKFREPRHQPAPPDPAVPPPAPDRAVRHRSSGVGRRSRLRHRPAPATARSSGRPGDRRANSPTYVGNYAVRAARRVAAAVGHGRARGARRRPDRAWCPRCTTSRSTACPGPT